MKKTFIKDLKAGDILVNHTFAVKSFSKKVGKTNNEYYTLELSDKTGTIHAKIWSDSFASCDLSSLKEGDVISLTGKVDTFNTDLQIIVQKFSILEDFNPDFFIPVSAKDIEKMYKNIIKEVEALEDKEVSKLILRILSNKKVLGAYKKVPAGQVVHHNFVGGLLEHVSEMLVFAKTAKKVYPEVNYPELVFGIIFHDIGKIYEYSFKGATIGRTKEGHLIGHIVLGVLFLEKFFPKDFDKKKKSRLLHLIVSHHGTQEQGSPVRPLTLEALLLSYIDNLSSQVGIYKSHLKQNEPNEEGFTTYNKYLGSILLKPSE